MVLLLLSLLLHGYIGLRIVPALAEPWAALGFAAVLAISAALMPFGLWALPNHVRRLARVTRWVAAKVALFHVYLALRRRARAAGSAAA